MTRVLYAGYKDRNEDFQNEFESFLKAFYRSRAGELMIKKTRKIADVKQEELSRYNLIIVDHLEPGRDFRMLQEVPSSVPVIITSTQTFGNHLEQDPKKSNVFHINKMDLATGVRELYEKWK